MSPAPDNDIAFAGPLALAALVRQKAVSPRELVELFLGRIEALEPHVNAFRTVIAEEALAGADAMTDPSGPLAGVPIAIKDDVAVAGQVATRGSRTHGPPAVADAEVVRRLRAAWRLQRPLLVSRGCQRAADHPTRRSPGRLRAVIRPGDCTCSTPISSSATCSPWSAAKRPRSRS